VRQCQFLGVRGVDIVAANQVWSADITYLPVLKGHFYWVAIMDWFSRKVLSWQVSNTMDVRGRCHDNIFTSLLNACGSR